MKPTLMLVGSDKGGTGKTTLSRADDGPFGAT